MNVDYIISYHVQKAREQNWFANLYDYGKEEHRKMRDTHMKAARLIKKMQDSIIYHVCG